MTSAGTGSLAAFLFLAVCSARAQVAVLGKGWLLDSAGSIVSTPGEVISGGNSIKGSFPGPDTGQAKPYLNTNPAIIRFQPNETYTITLKYRIVTPGPGGFQFGFFSSSAQAGGHFLPTSVIRGAVGASGMATLTSKLESYSDIRAGFSVGGSGTILIDDIRITENAGKLLAEEKAEGPTLAPGPLNFQLTDAIALLADASATVRSAAAKDLDGDGYPETILTLTAPPPSTTPLQPVVIEANGRMRLATSDFFPAGAPTVKHSPVTLFADIDNDGLDDILFAEAGSDGTPTPTGSGIGVALNIGGGMYRNLSSMVPADLQTTRSYSLAAGDLDGDGRVEILLPDEDDGTNTALLRWNGNGFDAQRNWIAPSLWKSPVNLVHNDWMIVDDFDNDGRQDLLVGANPVPGTPNLRLLFGPASEFGPANLLQLPDGLFGHATSSDVPVSQTADLGPIVAADLDNDGLPDIFAQEEQVLGYQPGVITDTNEPSYQEIRDRGGLVFADVGIQVLINRGSRRFVDVTSASSVMNLGRRHYKSLIPIDMNNDGFLDVVGLYQTKFYAGVLVQWGTTVFLNDGTGAFQIVEGAQLLAAVTTTPSNGQRWGLGAFVPALVNTQRIEGIVFESLGDCTLGFCNATGLNLYKVTADGAIGTGPNFTDPAAAGAPGFNEFFYLRHYADAAAAVEAGEYPDGLAHYLAVGRAMGYVSHAPDVPVVPSNSVVNSASLAAGTNPLAPGTIAAIFGTNLNDGSANPTSSFGTDGRLVTTLGGASITFNGVSAPVFASFPGQLNVQVPLELAGKAYATVVVTVDGRVSIQQAVPIGAYSPGIFSMNGQGTGQGVIAISATGELAAPTGSVPGVVAQPASRGQYITIYCTGLGTVTNPPETGAVALRDPLSATTETPTVTIGGLSAVVSFSGLAPDFVGVNQVNAEVPADAPSGDAVEVVMSIGALASNIVTIALR